MFWGGLSAAEEREDERDGVRQLRAQLTQQHEPSYSRNPVRYRTLKGILTNIQLEID